MLWIKRENLMANEKNSICIDVVDRGPVIDYNETDSISVYKYILTILKRREIETNSLVILSGRCVSCV